MDTYLELKKYRDEQVQEVIKCNNLVTIEDLFHYGIMDSFDTFSNILCVIDDKILVAGDMAYYLTEDQKTIFIDICERWDNV